MSVFKNFRILFFLLAFVFAPLTSVLAVNAGFSENSGLKATGESMNFSQANIEGTKTVETEISKYIKLSLSFVGIIFLILMIYAGYLWMTAQGTQGDVDKAKKIFASAVLGFFLVASAYTITMLVYQSVDV